MSTAVCNGKASRHNSKPLSVIPGGIPAELRADPRWVLWHLGERGKNGKPTKHPYRLDGNLAESDNPDTWTTFDNVLAAYQRAPNRWSGIGHVFAPGAGEVGIDLDHCRDPQTGAIEPWAQAIIKAAKTYAEISPSGTGVKLWCRGTLKTWKLGGKKTGKRKVYKTGAIEVYQLGRYFAITGHKLPNCPDTINDCQPLIDRLWEEVFAPTTPAPRPARKGRKRSTMSVAELARRARAYVAKMPPAISGQGGHNQTFAVACKLVYGFGLDVDQAIGIMREYNARCQPPWSEHELRHKVEDADSQAIERGHLLDAQRPAAKTSGRVRNAQSDSHPDDEQVAGAVPTIESPQGRTEVSNAKRFIARHGDKVRFCQPWRKWLLWDGKRHLIDDTRAVETLARDVCHEVWDQAERFVANEDVTRFAIATGSARGINATLGLARSEPGIPVRPAELDQHHWLLNCINGTLDLRTGKLRPHSRDDLLTKLCPTPFDPVATCPTWERFLNRIMARNVEVIGFLRRLAGYCATGIIREHILPIAWGGGANGKSTFVNALLRTLGPDYAMKADKNALVSKKRESHSTERMDFFGKRFAAAIETGDGQRLDEAMVKELTGGDPIRGRRMREDTWEYQPTHKLLLATNHKPDVRGTDFGIWRRLKLIPFTVEIPRAEQDAELPERLKAEAPGILAWIVKGCLEWQKHGLGEPAEVETATKSYRSEMDSVARFFAECCLTGPDFKVRLKSLRERYTEWCTEHGEHEVSGRRFGEWLGKRGFARYVSNGTWYEGIGIKGVE